MKLLYKSIGALLFMAQVSQGVPVTYTWTGTTDGDWTKSANWDGNGVPTDSRTGAGLTLLDPDSKIVFNAATVPTVNVPGFTDDWNHNTPALELTSGGILNISYTSYTGRGISSSATRDVFTVGGGASAVTLNFDFLTGNSLNTVINGTSTYRVGANGTLNLSATATTSIKFGRTAARTVVFSINGGTVHIDEELQNLKAFSGSYVDFVAIDGSLTAKFGSDFADIAAVNAEIALGNSLSSFRSSTGGRVSAFDNGNGTFTVIPKPATLGLVSAASVSFFGVIS